MDHHFEKRVVFLKQNFALILFVIVTLYPKGYAICKLHKTTDKQGQKLSIRTYVKV